MDDSFLVALAKGGYPIGELVKFYFPNDHDITSLDYDTAEQQTLKLLEQDQVIIYESAVRYMDLFIRIDVLVKNGKNFKLPYSNF